LAQLAENADSLRVMATKDPLTGLPNRALLHDLIEDAIEARRREGKCCAVFFLDLDRFKDINDSFGYRGGDALLRTIGERLRTSIGDQGAVGRLGGDEYLILINGLGEREALADIARRLIEVVGHPMEVDGTFARLNTSIGIARYPQDGERAEDLVSAADTAMHAAKARGRGEWSFFEKEMTEVAITRIQTETALRAGLSCGEFVVHYQPKLDLRSGLVSGAEALVRWRRDGVLVPPSRFIPIAEETGLIKELGLMVLADACDFIARRLDEGRPLAVAVNVSAVQLRDPGFLEDVMTLVGKRCPKPSLLELEITESAIMSQLDVRLRVLEQLRLMGICLAVDDFGTGYSSLSYLKRLPVDVLKIDRSFVVDLPNDTSIPRMILNLAAQLKLNTVAEGVERQDQLDWLRTMNCTMAQGYLIGRPGPAGDLDRCPVLSPYPSLSPPCEG
jgi:diguanylate cyclase (GGDEF)-like protein